MKTIITQMTHELLDCPVHELNTETLLTLKLELLRKVTEIHNEVTLREVAQGVQ